MDEMFCSRLLRDERGLDAVGLRQGRQGGIGVLLIGHGIIPSNKK